MSTIRPSTEKSTTVRSLSKTRKQPGSVTALRGGLGWLSQVNPNWAAWAADHAWTFPRRHQRPEWEDQVLQLGQAERIPFSAGDLAGWSWGAGPTVVLVHGWEGRGSQLGLLVGPLVAAGFRVLAYDAPGHGDSPGRRASLVTFTDALMAAVRHAGPVHGLIAHSFGGSAAAWALGSGLQVGGVVLVAPNDVRHGVRRYARWLGFGPAAREALHGRVIARAGAPMGRVSGAAVAGRMNTPMLLVHDRQDRFVPYRDGRGIADAWPQAQLFTTEGLGHHRILRDPAVVGRTVDFLRAVGQS